MTEKGLKFRKELMDEQKWNTQTHKYSTLNRYRSHPEFDRSDHLNSPQSNKPPTPNDGRAFSPHEALIEDKFRESIESPDLESVQMRQSYVKFSGPSYSVTKLIQINPGKKIRFYILI